MQRLACRQRRRRIITASIVAILVIVAGGVFINWFQNYTAHQAALAIVHATATSKASTSATATTITSNCFVVKNGPTVPTIYAATATPTAGPSSSPLLSGQIVTQKDGLKYVDIVTG